MPKGVSKIPAAFSPSIVDYGESGADCDLEAAFAQTYAYVNIFVIEKISLVELTN